jgi:transcriptional regulator with GAF, ATPase, and Fis domain
VTDIDDGGSAGDAAGDTRAPGTLGGAALAALTEIASRAAVAGRLEPPGGEAVLRSVVDATVALFDAEAASLLLYDPAEDRLVIRVAAGTAGEGAIGLKIPPEQGIAGYVYTTGQPLAIADVASDPRFGRTAAEATGYMPRSILGVPLLDDAGTIGVLEVLDRRGGGSFELRDLDLASVFARQATVAIRASRFERDVSELLRGVLGRLAGEDKAVPEEAISEIVAAAVEHLGTDDGSRLWDLADAVARVRSTDPGQVGLVIDILEALARRGARPTGRSFRR